MIALLLIVFNSCYTETFKRRDERARAVLEDVAVWFVEEGLSEYYQGKDLAYIEKSIQDRDAYLYAEIAIEKHGYLAIIVPAYWWVRSSVMCYSRVTKDFIYEYWVIKRFGGTRDDVRSEIYFLIAKTEGLDKKREIIHRTENFFPEFTTADGTVIHFPMDNESIRLLTPWKYPEAFKGTELEDVKIDIEEKIYFRKK